MTTATDRKWELVISVLKEKRAYDDRVQRTNYVTAKSVRTFTLLLENEMELTANYKQGRQMKPGDRIAFYKLSTKNGFGDFYNFSNGANSKPSPLLTVVFGIVMIACAIALIVALCFDSRNHYTVLIFASVFLLISAVSFFIERSGFVFMKRRHEEFLNLLKAAEVPSHG